MFEDAGLALPGIAHSIGAVGHAQHRTVDRPGNLFLHRPPEPSKELDRDWHRAELQVQPLVVKAVLLGVLGIDLQDIDVNQVRLVHGEGPSEVPVMTVCHDGHPGEQAANGIPAFFTVEMCFVPGNGSFPGLVRVHCQERLPVGGSRRGDGKRIAAQGI